MNISWSRLTLSLLAILIWESGHATLVARAATPDSPGIVVETIEIGFASHKAGLQPGDVLIRWQRAPSQPANLEPKSGDFNSPFDLLQVEVEQAPRGDVTLFARRAEQPLQVLMPKGSWRLTVRPHLSSEELEIYSDAGALPDTSFRETLSILQEMALNARQRGERVKAGWLFFKAATHASRYREWEACNHAFAQAQRDAEAVGEVWPQAMIQDFWSSSWIKQNDHDRAAAALHAARQIRQSSSIETLGLAVSFNKLGVLASNRGDMVAAEEFHRRGLEIREQQVPGSLEVAKSLNNLGNVALNRGELDLAQERYERSLAIKKKLSPEDTSMAASLGNLGLVTWNRGDLPAAERFFLEALAMQERLAPESLNAASTLHHLGVVAWSRGDLTAAEDYYARALTIKEKLAPGSLSLSESIGNLGLVEARRGDLVAAEKLMQQALVIKNELAPDSVKVAVVLGNLGSLATTRGDLVKAEDLLRRSLAIRERLTPVNLGTAANLTQLGEIAQRRGNRAQAKSYYLRALATNEKLAPEGLEVATSLSHLGSVAQGSGEHEAAASYYRQSLKIRRQLAPKSLQVATSLQNLGALAIDRGDLSSAERLFVKALAIRERLAPKSLESAESMRYLGDIDLARSNLGDAEEKYRQSLALRREFAAGSVLEADICRRLATLHRQRKQLEEAFDFYDCALDALDAQKGKLGGSDEVRAAFAANYAEYYREAIGLSVETGKTEKAFYLLERYRARELLGLLAERDLGFASDLPEELERDRRISDASYDQAFGQWMQLSHEADSKQRQQARERLDEARRRQDEIRAQVRAAAPRLAALQDPEPLDLEGMSAVLDPGTLLLSFSVGKHESYLFALGPQKGALRAFPLGAGEAELKRKVEAFREAIRHGRVDRRPAKVLLAGEELSQRLFGPVSEHLAKAKRLMILADGPLHSLPFAALVDPGARGGRRRFLIEAIPLHRVASGTVFAHLKQDRRERRKIHLTAFGDPHYPTQASPDDELAPRLRAALSRGLDLAPLPATRSEVESLKRLFPTTSEIYLGKEATETKAKSVGRATAHLHIATHGLLDDRFPLDSALAFSIPSDRRDGEDNGLLQAWEIFEQVRIDADLVTLSGCDTGRGKVLGGEGLQGLTRAFQYAGARSVLASLWSISDQSTGELMTRFYSYLKEDQTKVEALRSAQLDLLRDTEFSHPFHWAGFELVGDWQ